MTALFRVKGKDSLYSLFRSWQASFDDHIQVELRGAVGWAQRLGVADEGRGRWH